MRLFIGLLGILGLCSLSMSANPQILVFSEIGQWRDPAHTLKGFYHASIPAGKAMLTQMGKDHNLDFTFTDNSSAFTDEGLAPYQALIFLNPNGYVLNDEERLAFQRFIRSGKGFVGIHAAANCELNWPWYIGLIGVYETGVEAGDAQGKIIVKDNTHISTQNIPATFTVKDEYLKYNGDVRNLADKSFKILAVVDESSYKGGSYKDHPVAWYHEYDGGRVWYTGFGHQSAVFSDKNVIEHIWGGIQYALKEANQAQNIVMAENGNLFSVKRTREQLQVYVPTPGNLGVQVVNLNGQIFLKQVSRINKAGWANLPNISNPSAGQYIYRITFGNQVITKYDLGRW